VSTQRTDGRLELARGVLARLPDEDRATLREAAALIGCTLLEAAVTLLPPEASS
jgi:hypothetical protein